MREKIWKQYDNDKSRLTVCRKLIAKQGFYDDLSVVFLNETFIIHFVI